MTTNLLPLDHSAENLLTAMRLYRRALQTRLNLEKANSRDLDEVVTFVRQSVLQQALDSFDSACRIHGIQLEQS